MRISAILLPVLLAVSQLSYAYGNNNGNTNGDRNGNGNGYGHTSLEQAISEARQEYPGQVISARTQRWDGRETHNVRILTRDGQVRRLRFDANSGRRLPSWGR